jgi:hypothetical protein
MRVPRPFDPEEINQPQGKESKKNIERKEKPIADENQQQSEDFHGGNESTESLPDSPNEGSEEQQEDQQKSGESSASNNQQSQSSNGEQSQQSNSGESSSENSNSDDKQSSSEYSSQGESQQSQSQQSGSNESVNESSTDDTSEQPNSENKQGSSENQQQGSSGTESSESGDGQQSSGEQSGKQSSSQTDDSEESNNEQEASDSDSQESNGEDGETSSDTSNASEEGDTDDDTNDTNGQNGETFDSEEEGQEEASDSSQEDEEQVNSGTYNTNQVFTYTSAKNNTKLSKALYDFIEYIADETKVFNNLSADYYDPKKLMLRRYQGKSLNAAKSGKVRETIVVLLDNSGSMDWVREHVLETASALIQRHDAEIYFAPNGQVECQITKHGEVPVVHGNVINKIVTQQLKVLYIGDFDGAKTPIELSWKTKVFWLCPESRYRRFQSHRWISYDESAFRGFFARTYDAREMVQALKRFSGFAQFSRCWYDPHEREVFQDD